VAEVINISELSCFGVELNIIRNAICVVLLLLIKIGLSAFKLHRFITTQFFLMSSPDVAFAITGSECVYQTVQCLTKNIDSAYASLWNKLLLLSREPFRFMKDIHVLDFLILTFYVLTDILYAFVWTNTASVKLDVNNNNNNNNNNNSHVEHENNNNDNLSTSSVNIYVNNRTQKLTYSEFITKIKAVYRLQKVSWIILLCFAIKTSISQR